MTPRFGGWDRLQRGGAEPDAPPAWARAEAPAPAAWASAACAWVRPRPQTRAAATAGSRRITEIRDRFLAAICLRRLFVILNWKPRGREPARAARSTTLGPTPHMHLKVGADVLSLSEEPLSSRMRSPRVSVVIPTHDRAHLLPETLASVLGQEGAGLE